MSFYEELTLESIDWEYDGDDNKIKQVSMSTSKIAKSECASVDSSCCTPSITESVGEEEEILKVPPPPFPNNEFTNTITPKVDLTRKAWARLQRSQVCSKLKQLDQHMHSVFGSSIGRLSTVPSEEFQFDTSMRSTENVLPASMRSPDVLMEKRLKAQQKRQNLKQAFLALTPTPAIKSSVAMSSSSQVRTVPIAESQFHHKISRFSRKDEMMQMPVL